MSATLANTHGNVFCFKLLSFRSEDFNDQSGNGKDKPLDGNPPKSDKTPPKYTMVLCLELGFRSHLDIYIFTSALRTFHKYNPFLKHNI